MKKYLLLLIISVFAGCYAGPNDDIFYDVQASYEILLVASMCGYEVPTKQDFDFLTSDLKDDFTKNTLVPLFMRVLPILDVLNKNKDYVEDGLNNFKKFFSEGINIIKANHNISDRQAYILLLSIFSNKMY